RCAGVLGGRRRGRLRSRLVGLRHRAAGHGGPDGRPRRGLGGQIPPRAGHHGHRTATGPGAGAGAVTPQGQPPARRPWLLAVASLAALAALLAADAALRANLTSAQASAYGLFFQVAFGAFTVGSTAAGALIVVRQRRNVIGWLLLAIP